MALAKTGFTSSTPENFIIDAATVYKNLTFDGSEFSGTLVGATSGGVTVNIEQSYRKPEVDGTYHTEVKGLKQLESAVCNVTMNLKELTAENLRQSLNGTMEDAGELEAPAGYKKITTKRYVEDGDYIPTIAVVGRLSGTDKPVIFVLDNALATEPLELSTEDNGEAVVEQTLTAHASYEQLAADEFPWRIFYPNEVTS